MVEIKHHIACILVFLSVSIYGQNENALDNAQREYERGNYERSLSYLNAGTGEEFSDKAIAIKNLWLLSENYIELQYPEQQIIQQLKSIYTIDPLFTKEKYNLDVSGSVENRLNTIHVDPRWVINLSVSRDAVLPMVTKEPYICPECVDSDEYSKSEPGMNMVINLAFFYRKNLGLETGVGYTFTSYSRNLKAHSRNDEYTLNYNERLHFIDVPFRYIIALNKWNFRIGANYKYLIQSNAKTFQLYSNSAAEPIRQEYPEDDLQKLRNRNLVFLGFNIDRRIYPAKSKSFWYLSVFLDAQVGLNSFISIENRLSNIDFISNTYYTDDKVSLTMLGVGLRINYNAKYKISE